MTQGANPVRRLAFWSIPLAFAVLGLKLGAWHLTGSVALLSDGLESIVNVIAALIAFFVIAYAHKPADDDHPYGHSKAEYFSAVIEGVLIVLAALMIVRAAWPAILDPEPIEAPVSGLVVNGIASVINGLWAWLLIRVGRSHRSPALQADGHHILSDVVTSGGVIVGLILALALKMPILDPLLALVVATAVAGAAGTADRVDLVDEHDAGRVLLGLLEHVADTACADTHEHLDEVGARDGEERHARLARD